MKIDSIRIGPSAKLAKNTAIVVVTAVIVLASVTFALGYLGVSLNLNPSKVTTISTSSATQPVVQQGASCSYLTGWAWKQSEVGFGSDSLAGTVAINGFTAGTATINGVSQSAYTAVGDLTAAASPATSTGQYPLDGSYLLQYTETSTVLTYPIWWSMNAASIGTIPAKPTVLATMGGNNVLTVGCSQSASNSAANIWTIVASPLQAPTSGTSATTNVKALCVNSNGNSLTTAATAFPTTATPITCTLQILQAYRGAGYTVPLYGSQSNAIQSFLSTGTGATYYGPVPSSAASVDVNPNVNGGVAPAGSVERQMVAIIYGNNTAININDLNGSPAGLSLLPITTTNVASGDKVWLVTGFTGCSPATGSASSSAPYACLSFTMDAYASSHSGHLAFQVQFTDMQSVNYLLANLASTAKGSFGSSTGSIAGAASGYSSGITPTSGSDAATPAILVEQSYQCLNS